ncbi:glycosyltransferase [Thalassobacillus sp. C254]|uniref:glycosyltransferase n=1 Tax=Thalassobacillus sp. C254 TaxID=1225341 RepID=UPI0006D16069|nr:glycosyltransferase [Thalassobacillus sp. C254]
MAKMKATKDKKELKVVFLTPYLYSIRGNATTAKRLTQALSREGVSVKVASYEEESNEKIKEFIAESDIVHALHVRRFVEWLSETGIKITQPLLLTSGGTDVNVDFNDPDKLKEMKDIINQSSGITVFTQDGKEKVLRSFPESKGKVHIIPQGIQLEDNKEVDMQLPAGCPKILLPAGLRPVKDVLFLGEALVSLRKVFPDLQFAIIGANLDEETFREVKTWDHHYKWFHYWEPVPLDRMSTLYEWADIVVNTSSSEGQPMAVLEAMAWGTPVLARNIPGNKSVIFHGSNGYLFNNAEEFMEQCKTFMASTELQHKFISGGKKTISKHHDPSEEAKAYLYLYKESISKNEENKG